MHIYVDRARMLAWVGIVMATCICLFPPSVWSEKNGIKQKQSLFFFFFYIHLAFFFYSIFCVHWWSSWQADALEVTQLFLSLEAVKVGVCEGVKQKKDEKEKMKKKKKITWKSMYTPSYIFKWWGSNIWIKSLQYLPALSNVYVQPCWVTCCACIAQG